MGRKPTLTERVNEIEMTLNVSIAMFQSGIRVTQRLCEEIGRKAGVEKIDGMPLPKWCRCQVPQELHRSLREIEDLNPALAALLQQRIDEIQKIIDELPGETKNE
jgi:hypothetical protein